MKTYLMKKAMIETAVDQGLKLIEEDPKRSLRRLADLGKQFSKNRFQDMLFSIIQELLNNEDSAYYDMMERLLENADHDALKKFGINFGYMSWTYGASEIRKKEPELGCCIPWTILLRYDPSREDGLTIDRLTKLFQEGQELGMYAWLIREEDNSSDSYDLLELLERYKECAFVWIKANGRLTAAQVQMLKLCKGTVVSLPLDDPETFLTVALLREQKIPFALHREYSTDEFNTQSDEWHSFMDNVLSSQTALIFLIARDDATYSAGQLAYDSRLTQDNPFIVMDYYADALRLSKILSEHPYLLEIGADGCMKLPDAHDGDPFPFDLPLSKALQQVMPAFPAAPAGDS